MFRVKICGVRLEEDVRSVGASGGDAIGLNFFPPSVRFVDPESPLTKQLSDLSKSLGILRVGVFVNESAANMLAISERVGLDAIQMHGDESVETAEELVAAGKTVVRAIKLPKGEFPSSQLVTIASRWTRAGCHLLLDVDAGAAHGGSGNTLDWPSVANWANSHPEATWTLAGGLKPENVAEAIRVSGTISVDTASGVECPRGVKNPGRIEAFVKAAHDVGRIETGEDSASDC